MKRKVMVAAGFVSMSLLLAGCEESVSTPEDSYNQAAQANEQAVNQMIENDVLPEINVSLERENLKRRAEFINQADRIGYLYLLSDSGQLIKEVQVLGKVSSLNSYLTPMEDIQIVRHEGDGSLSMETPVTTQAADIDGTWGENAAGIFWFDADGIYQEWSGMYFYSAERQSFTTQPVLVEVAE